LTILADQAFSRAMGTPLVSICIPTYRHAEFIAETVRCALAQDYPHLEIVISDDASPDETPEVLSSFEDPRLRIIRQPVNLGRDENCNACIRASRGDYVLKLDSDDLITPDHVRLQADILARNPRVSFAHCACRLIDAAGRHLGYERSIHGGFIRDGRAEFRRYTFGSHAVNIVMLRRSCFDQAGGYSGQFSYAGDWAMHLKMLLAGDVAYNDRVIASYRMHGVAKEHIPPLLARDTLKILTEFIPQIWPSDLPGREETLRRARREAAYDMALHSGDQPRAIREQILRVAQELYPGYGVAVRASLARTVPGQVKRFYEYKSVFRQGVKRFLYRREPGTAALPR
jgi:glycosyltransferase involved in cell wall biosynthesis